jgi:hypothetical protein
VCGKFSGNQLLHAVSQNCHSERISGVPGFLASHLAQPHIDTDPQLADAKAGDFRLRENSPAWKIGLYNSDDRASWPVVHAVRPKPENRPATR